MPAHDQQHGRRPATTMCRGSGRRLRPGARAPARRRGRADRPRRAGRAGRRRRAARSTRARRHRSRRGTATPTRGRSRRRWPRREDDLGGDQRHDRRRLGVLRTRQQQVPHRVEAGRAEREGKRGRRHVPKLRSGTDVRSRRRLRLQRHPFRRRADPAADLPGALRRARPAAERARVLLAALGPERGGDHRPLVGQGRRGADRRPDRAATGPWSPTARRCTPRCARRFATPPGACPWRSARARTPRRSSRSSRQPG